MTIINWDIAKHPLNWATVILMLMFASLALHLVLSVLDVSAAQPTNTTPTVKE